MPRITAIKWKEEKNYNTACFESLQLAFILHGGLFVYQNQGDGRFKKQNRRNRQSGKTGCYFFFYERVCLISEPHIYIFWKVASYITPPQDMQCVVLLQYTIQESYFCFLTHIIQLVNRWLPGHNHEMFRTSMIGRTAEQEEFISNSKIFTTVAGLFYIN